MKATSPQTQTAASPTTLSASSADCNMLCSIPTANGNGKSGSNWLTRLRSNKGFPTSDDLDLDQFLTSDNPSTSDSPPVPNASTDKPLPSPNPPASTLSRHHEWFGLMSNVLSELFNVGHPTPPSTFLGRKTSRKQQNPKFCILHTPLNDNIREDRSSSHCIAIDQSLNSVKEEDTDNNDVEEEKGDRDRELLGYSRSEVTVIDTSCDVWKFDKLVFRRKNIWKVRDKKIKSRTVGRKKRKGNASDDNHVSKKKPQISTSELRSLKEAAGRDFTSTSNHEQNPRGENRKQACKETLKDLDQIEIKRLPRKSTKGGSSVIHIKAIPTSNKN